MAARAKMMSVVLLAAVCMALLNHMTAFCGMQPALRTGQVAMRGKFDDVPLLTPFQTLDYVDKPDSWAEKNEFIFVKPPYDYDKYVEKLPEGDWKKGPPPNSGPDRFTTVYTRKSMEMMVSVPAIGDVTRVTVTPDTTVAEVRKRARENLGLNQDWMPDADWKMYQSKDQPAIADTAAVKDSGLTDFGYVLEMYYEPANYAA